MRVERIKAGAPLASVEWYRSIDSSDAAAAAAAADGTTLKHEGVTYIKVPGNATPTRDVVGTLPASVLSARDTAYSAANSGAACYNVAVEQAAADEKLYYLSVADVGHSFLAVVKASPGAVSSR